MSVVNLVLKPVVQKTYEAMKLTAENRNELADWCGGIISEKHDGWRGIPMVLVPRVRDDFWVKNGDWVVKDPHGRFYKYTENELFTKFEEVV